MYALIDGTRYECSCVVFGPGLVRMDLDQQAPETVSQVAVYDEDGVAILSAAVADYAHYSKLGTTLALHDDDVDLTPAEPVKSAPLALDLNQLRADVDFLAAMQGVSL